MSLFDKEKPTISRRNLREKLGRASGGGKFSQQERRRFESEVFTKRPGGSISKQNYDRTLKDLRVAERKATGSKRLELQKQRRFLENLKKAA